MGPISAEGSVRPNLRFGFCRTSSGLGRSLLNSPARFLHGPNILGRGVLGLCKFSLTKVFPAPQLSNIFQHFNDQIPRKFMLLTMVACRIICLCPVFHTLLLILLKKCLNYLVKKICFYYESVIIIVTLNKTCSELLRPCYGSATAPKYG